MKRFLKLTLAYDGANYVGWQVQENGLAVQQVVEQAWTKVTQETIRIQSSGRTDAGVHALAQVCSLATDSTLDGSVLVRALNAHLPQDVRVCQVQHAASNFHAIRDAIDKTYRYYIQHGPIHDVFLRQRCWHIPQTIDLTVMRAGAQLLVGRHDFASFQASGSDRASTTRTVSSLAITPRDRRGYRFLELEITADGFLYNMVRNIVGTLVEVGLKRQPTQWVQQVLDACDRDAAGMTAPAHGLFLVAVRYRTSHLR